MTVHLNTITTMQSVYRKSQKEFSTGQNSTITLDIYGRSIIYQSINTKLGTSTLHLYSVVFGKAYNIDRNTGRY